MQTNREIKQIHTLHQDILSSIYRQDISRAVELIRGWLDQLDNDNLQMQFNGILSNYHLVLDHLARGTKDEARSKLYLRTCRQFLDLVDRMRIQAEELTGQHPLKSRLPEWQQMQEKGNPFFLEGMRNLMADHQLNESLGAEGFANQISGKIHRDQLNEALFFYAWLSPALEEDENLEALQVLLKPGSIPANEQAVIVSGLNLGSLSRFSLSRIKLQIDLVRHPNAIIRVRAITGIIQSIHQYSQRFPFYPELSAALETMLADFMHKEELEIILMQVIRSQDTEAITKKLQDEIIPEMVKMTPRITERFEKGSLSLEDFDAEENPDWEQFLEEQPELMNKLQEFQEMQMEGADVFMSAFANLKHFPFFNQVHHWFTPFYQENRLVIDEMHRLKGRMDIVRFLDGLTATRFLCNSDKYSFLFNIHLLSDQQLKMLDQHFSAEMKMMNEMQQEDTLLDAHAAFRSESRMYIQDLYRFHKLHPLGRNIPDFFQNPLYFRDKDLFGKYLEEQGLLRKMAEFHFTRKHYPQAAKLFTYLAESEIPSYEVFEKAGFAFQKLEQFDKAIAYYRKAELFDTNQAWLMKKLAYCYRQTGRPMEAIPFMKQAIKLDPENIRLKIQLANTFLEAEKYKDALNHYYEVELSHPEDEGLLRPLAWCLMQTGKAAKAVDCINRIPGESKLWNDYLNLGHALWVDGQQAEAFKAYRIAHQKSANPIRFHQALQQDERLLQRQGISTEACAMLKDVARLLWQ
jgi:tetratricopeptide (TPR) repeat protein